MGGLRAIDVNVGKSPHGIFTDRAGALTNDWFVNLLPMDTKWTALDDDDTTMAAYLKINVALEWFDFSQALELYKAPMQNFVFADFKNNIGYYAPGALPIRAKGDGSVPVPGWTGEYDWTGYVPFKELPHAYNPEEGFIVSANNKAVPDSSLPPKCAGSSRLTFQ